MFVEITLEIWELLVIYVAFLGASMIVGSFFAAMFRHFADSFRIIKDKKRRYNQEQKNL